MAFLSEIFDTSNLNAMDKKKAFRNLAAMNGVAGIVYTILLCMFWHLPLCSNDKAKVYVGLSISFCEVYIVTQLLNLVYIRLLKANIRIMATFNFFLTFILYSSDNIALMICLGYATINFLAILFVFRRRKQSPNLV